MTRLPKLKTDGQIPWRALLTDPGAEWLQLPVLTRAVACEILRRLDSDKCIVAPPGVPVWQAVSRAIAADPRERRVIKTALEQLADGRWIELRDDRLVAYFPDLGSERAAPRPRHDGDVTTTAPRRDHDTSATAPRHDHDVTATGARHDHDGQSELTPTPDTNSDVESRGEKRRIEERRGDARGRAREPSPPAGRFEGMVESIRASFVEAFRSTGEHSPPWSLGLTNREWAELAQWVAANYAGAEVETAARLGTGFARSKFARSRGHRFRGPGGLIEGPGEFLALAGHVQPSEVKHTETSDEDFEKAMAAT